LLIAVFAFIIDVQLKWNIIIQLILIELLFRISNCLIGRQLGVNHIHVKIFRNDSRCCRANHLAPKSLVFLTLIIFYRIIKWLFLILIKCMWGCCFFLYSACVLVSIDIFCLQLWFVIFNHLGFILLEIEFFKYLIIWFYSFHILSIIFQAQIMFLLNLLYLIIQRIVLVHELW
jgi:hypothetical protein